MDFSVNDVTMIVRKFTMPFLLAFAFIIRLDSSDSFIRGQDVEVPTIEIPTIDIPTIDIPTIDIVVYPCPVSDPPAAWKLIERGAPSIETTQKQRQAFHEAWRIQVTRNENPAFDDLLGRRPKDALDDELIAWISYMQEMFGGPIDLALDAAQKSGPAPIEPQLDSEGDLSLVPPNGAIILAEHVLDSVIYYMVLDGPESVLDNLPQVFQTLGDWNESLDATYPLWQSQMDRLLEELMQHIDCPNLGQALLTTKSPLARGSSFYRTHRATCILGGKSDPKLLSEILDPKVPDAKVLNECKLLLTKTFQSTLDQNTNTAESREAWFEQLTKEAPKNLQALQVDSETLRDYSKIHPLRIAVMASVARFDRFSKWHETLHSIPISDAIKLWQDSLAKDEWKRGQPQWMCEISNSFLIRPSRPYDYWVNQQTIQATSLVFVLRNYVAQHGEFPEELELLNRPEATIDPITNKPFNYRKTSPKDAFLNLSAYDHRPGNRTFRKRYHLITP